MLGSIGVVYGDIGTSPLYAFREAVAAASAGGETTSHAVLGVISLILWALIIVVTLKYVVILLRADNNGEGGTLALMALAQRAVSSQWAGTIVLLGIISGALFYGDAVITPALSVLSAIEGIKLVTVAARSLCRAAHGDHPACAVRRAVARHRAGRRVLRPDHVIWFLIIGIAAVPLILRKPEILFALNPFLCRLVHAHSRHHRLRDARRRVPRGDRRRSALCRSRPFRQEADPDRLALHRAARR